jgi:uncharacterized protein YfiM (DUF2279 family)
VKHALALAFLIQTSGNDGWWSADKAKHFFLGAFAQSVSYGVLRAARVAPHPALAGAAVITFGTGLGKEIHDRFRAGDPSAKDLAWTLGGAIAISPLLLRSK